MPDPSNPSVYLIIDLEMTGLDPGRHTIVEIACLITNSELELIDDGIDIVVHADASALSEMDDFVRDMHDSGKPTCAICHGQWVMVSADILRGKKATAVWNIQVDLANAGATVLDEPCVVDGNLITARFPYDLPRMVDALVKQLVK